MSLAVERSLAGHTRHALHEIHVEYAQTRAPLLRERLVVGHMALAMQLAKRFGPRGTQTQDDVNQVACLALIKAVDGFDPSRGIRFSTYATAAILGELKRNLRDHTWSVRPSRSAHDLYLAMESALDELTNELRRRPTLDELASRLGVSVDEVVHAQEVAGGRVASSLDRPLPGGREALGEAIGGDDSNLRLVEQRATLRSLLTALSDSERAVVALRFREGMSQAAIARELGTSQMHVSRVLRRALETMRQMSDDSAA
jgi:RNA polymerase sigma-B factor